MALVVHHLNDSRSQRVLWLLEELGLGYEIRHYRRDPQTLRAPPELREVHPLGKSPVVTDGDTVVAESGAIVEFLVEAYGGGRLKPADGTPELARWRYWLHFAEGTAMPMLLLKLVFDQMRAAPLPPAAKPVAENLADGMSARLVTPQLHAMLDFMEGELARSDWFAGDAFTAADIQMSFPVEAARQRAGLDAAHPRLMAWLDRIHQRPAYRRAIERGGPYAFA